MTVGETVTVTLSGFLLARIADDEATAQFGHCFCAWCDADERPVGWLGANPKCDARVLAECEAKRRIVGQCAPVARGYFPCTALASDTLAHLALPYADHPDYRDEWKP